MEKYTFRKANPHDADFCIETMLKAESSNSNTQPLTSIFNISEEQIRTILKKIILEDVPGNEMAISVFTIVEINGKYAGACGCWIEECEDIPSTLIKSNLLNYYFPPESIEHALPVLEKLKPFQYSKERHAAYFEYLYILPEYRSINLLLQLMEESSKNAILSYPQINVHAIYGGTSGTNPFMIRATRRIGFQLYKTITLDDEKLLEYIPSLTRYVMKKILYP